MKFVLPENWRELSDTELIALASKAVAASHAAVRDNDGDEVERISALASEVSVELDTRQSSAALANQVKLSVENAIGPAMKEALSELLAELQDGDAADEDADEDEAPADADLESEEDDAEDGDADEADAETEGDEAGDDAEGGDTDAPAPEDLSDADTKLPAAPREGGARELLLARNVGSFKAGEPVTELEMANIFHEVAKDMSVDQGKIRLATLSYGDDLPHLGGQDYDKDVATLSELIKQAGPGLLEDFVASGGWGTPSEIDYGFFVMEGAIDMLDLPRTTVNRGGLQFLEGPEQPQFRDIIGTDAFWKWTEANDIAASGSSPRKTKLKMPIPTAWDDVRLEAWGVVLENGNLVDRSWPELTRRWMRFGVLGHQQHVNAARIAAIRAASTARDFTGIAPTNDGVTATALEAIEYLVEYTRDQYYNRSLTIDVIIPHWLTATMRADLSRRSGMTEFNVTDGVLLGYLRAKGINIQTPHDYDMLGASIGTVDGPWPTTAEITAFPSGTWVIGTGGSLTLGVMRDADQIETNDHTAMWTEDFLSLMQFGPESVKITIDVKPTGWTNGATS